MASPIDRRVVEAYWLGNALLDGVGARPLNESLETRFRPRVRPESWRWLAGKPEAGGVPVHAFHVLDVFPRVGLLRTGSIDGALAVMDSCRIRWGRVLERDGDYLVVNAVPLVMAEGKIALGPAHVERVQAWRDGVGFMDETEPDDVISIHWSWACDRLSPQRLADLVSWTVSEIDLANMTL